MHIIDLQDSRNRIPFRILCLHADAIGDDPYLLTDERSYSFNQGNAVVNAYAHGLRRLGLRAGERLMIYMHSCVEFVLLTLAANKLGAQWGPVNTDYRGDWVVETINASKGAVLATDANLLERLRPVEHELRYGRLLLRGPADSAGEGFARRGVMSFDELADHSDAEPETKHIGYGDPAAVLQVGEQVRQDLAGVELVGQAVDDGYARVGVARHHRSLPHSPSTMRSPDTRPSPGRSRR